MFISVIEGTHNLELALEYFFLNGLHFLLQKHLSLHGGLEFFGLLSPIVDSFLYAVDSIILFILYLSSQLVIFLH